MVGSEIGAQGAIGVFVGTRHDSVHPLGPAHPVGCTAIQSVESLRRRPADIGHSALSFAVRLPETVVRYPHVNGHEEARADGHESPDLWTSTDRDVGSLQTDGGRWRVSTSLVESVHALVSEGVGEAV